MKARSAYPVINSLSHKMTFGKYKGKTVQSIMVGNPSYLLYLANRDIIKISNSIRIKTQSLLDRESKLKAIAYSHRNHNYSSYYDDPDDEVWSYFDPH